MKYILNVVVVVLFVLLPVYVPELRHSVYIGLGAFITGIVTLSVCPYIAFNMHRAPLYVEDIEKSNDKKLIGWFKTLLILSTSVGFGLVVEFAWERFHNDKDIRLVEVLGVFGGLIALFNKIHMVAGKVLLACFGCVRKKPLIVLEESN